MSIREKQFEADICCAEFLGRSIGTIRQSPNIFFQKIRLIYKSSYFQKYQLEQWNSKATIYPMVISELAATRRITNDEYYMECDNLMYEDDLMLLHSSSSIKSFVEQELNWCDSPKLQPYCIKSES